MKKTYKIVNRAALILFCLGFTFALFGQTQERPSEITYTNGMILSSESMSIKTQPMASKGEYDINVFGVYYESSKPIHNEIQKEMPFRTKGVAYVKCNDSNGMIKKGDAITTSAISGEGMKATESGMIVGVALEDASESSGLVKTRILIQYMK